jgi:elongation factor Ts
MEQNYILDDSKKVKDILTEAIAKIGENIKVSRFVRMKVGEE